MPLTREEIERSYQFLLGHPPPDESVIETHIASTPDAATLRRKLIHSKEFELEVWSKEPLSAAQRKAGWTDFAEPKTVFVHIPKTAGTTMVKILHGIYDQKYVLPLYRDLRGYAASYLARFRLIRGHFMLHDIQYVPGPKRVFTILRNPKRRVLSQYRYHRARLHKGLTDDVLAKKAALPLNDYLSDPFIRRHELVNNTQTRFLFCLFPDALAKYRIDPAATATPFYKIPRATLVQIAKDNLERMDCIGTAEQFDDFLELFAAAWGLPEVPTYERQNETSAVLDPGLHMDEPDGRTDALLERLNDLDDQVFEFGKQLFVDRLAARRRETQPNAAQ